MRAVEEWRRTVRQVRQVPLELPWQARARGMQDRMRLVRQYGRPAYHSPRLVLWVLE